ncbi:hypothetical protein [Acinetobacter sp. CFCC 10889]|uniref:hypothetical protein n=1 Tax=Acinetobacter sp. CFCC 10889 TaxID=1775557 RepID=UPI000DCF8E17|nr:hypothetical protein [Acinetobacter sp. CFCC 10889]
MFAKITDLFKGKAAKAELEFLENNHIQIDSEQGFIVDGIVLNQELAERLEYFSNRKLKNFDDLNALFYKAILINEKIDLEIASGRYVARLDNTEENLKQLKAIIQKLNDYYKAFKREK